MISCKAIGLEKNNQWEAKAAKDALKAHWLAKKWLHLTAATFFFAR